MAADTVVKEAQRDFFRARCRRPRSSLSLSLSLFFLHSVFLLSFMGEMTGLMSRRRARPPLLK